MSKEKHILNAQKSPLKFSLDISHSQVLLSPSGFRKSSALSLLPSRLPEGQCPESVSPHSAFTLRLSFWLVCFVTHHCPRKEDLPPALEFFSLAFPNAGSRGHGEYSPPLCGTCTNS